MKATKFCEEELRPALPAQTRQTWTLAAKELIDTSPEIYAGIVSRLSDGDTNAQVAKLTGFPIELIRKIRELHPSTIEAGRRAAHARIEEALHSASEKLVEQINAGKIKGSQLVVAAGILFDKSQLITGGATQRIEKVDVKSPDQLKAMFEALPEAKVEVIK